MTRRPLAAALALALAVALAAFAGRHLWRRATLLVLPAVVFPETNVRAVTEPSLRARLTRALEGYRPADPAARARLIALTFDDGPYAVDSPVLLATLRRLGVPATFFLIGRDARSQPALTRDLIAGGMEIADHTETHPDLDRLPDAAVRTEIVAGAGTLRGLGAPAGPLRLFRPPHGRFTTATLRVAQGLGDDTILWTDDPGDWRDTTPDALVAHVVARATAPEILLLHSGREATVGALPAIVERFRAAGYQFVTVGTLLRRVDREQLDRPARRPLGR